MERKGTKIKYPMIGEIMDILKTRAFIDLDPNQI
jgi:hypothetical protein